MKELGMYIIAYDISDSKERAKVVKCVEQYCRRVQKSVWIGSFSGQSLKKMRGRLEAMDIKTGVVDIWEACARPVRVGGDIPFPELSVCHVV